MAKRPKKEVPPEVRDYFRAIDAEGGYSKKGGEARAKSMTAKRRSEIAKKAAQARWAKPKPSKKRK